MTKTGWLKGQWATLPPDDSPLLGSRGRIWETYIILSAICQNTAFWTACRYENWEQPVLIIHDRSSVPVTVAEKSSDYVIIHDLTCQNGGTANHRIFVHAKSLAAISALCPFSAECRPDAYCKTPLYAPARPCDIIAEKQLGRCQRACICSLSDHPSCKKTCGAVHPA